MLFFLRHRLTFAVAGVCAILIFASGLAYARIGVGVGTGKIILDEPLKPGGAYALPALPVLNTGDEPGEYEVSIAYHLDQPQRMPAREWFLFRPATFHLEANASRVVGITISLPVRTAPGEYFAYVEARPKRTSIAGEARVGVAAAAKLYFTVEPANMFQGIYYYVGATIARYAPWSHVGFIVMAAAAVFTVVRRFVHLDIGIRVRKR